MRNLFTLIFVILFIGAVSAGAFGQVENAPDDINKFVNGVEKKEEKPVEINKLVYGDLNGDKVPDAVIQYNVQIGFPGNDFISYIAVFLKIKGRYVFTAKMENGAKLAIVLVPVSVKNKIILFNKYGENGFKKIGTARYRLGGKKLVKV